MRFAILAAVAALGFSAPASATTWIFGIDATFDYTSFITTKVCNEGVGECYPTATFQRPVDISYIVSTGAFTDSYQVGSYLFDFGGENLRVEHSFLFTKLAFDNNGISASGTVSTELPMCNGDIQGWPIGCRYGYGTGVMTKANVRFLQAVDGPAPVPEPATWAMMIGGFGMVGGSMRLSRRRASGAASLRIS